MLMATRTNFWRLVHLQASLLSVAQRHQTVRFSLRRHRNQRQIEAILKKFPATTHLTIISRASVFLRIYRFTLPSSAGLVAQNKYFMQHSFSPDNGWYELGD